MKKRNYDGSTLVDIYTPSKKKVLWTLSITGIIFLLFIAPIIYDYHDIDFFKSLSKFLAIFILILYFFTAPFVYHRELERSEGKKGFAWKLFFKPTKIKIIFSIILFSIMLYNAFLKVDFFEKFHPFNITLSVFFAMLSYLMVAAILSAFMSKHHEVKPTILDTQKRKLVEKEPPTEVKIISVLFYLSALMELLFGILILMGISEGADYSFLSGVKSGIYLISIGLIIIVIGRGLWLGKHWSRISAITFIGLILISDIYSAIKGAVEIPMVIILRVIIIYVILFNKKIKDFFLHKT